MAWAAACIPAPVIGQGCNGGIAFMSTACAVPEMVLPVTAWAG